MNTEVRLWRKNQIGIGTWRIWVEDLTPTTAVLHYAHATVTGGAEVRHKDLVTLNKSGRTIEQQVALEMESRVSRQRDKGYKSTVEEAQSGSTNQLNLLNPMLAQTLEKVSSVDFTDAYVQPKYDGHRCLITRQGDLIAYTRKGKIIVTIPHVLRDFEWLPEGKTVDGELYVHGRPLQSISSLIKREQPDSRLLKYHWYDWVGNKPFGGRLKQMKTARERYFMPNTVVVPTYEVKDLSEARQFFEGFRKEGFEGAMLRTSISGYQANVRAAQLLKMKSWLDCEVTAIGVSRSKDGWAILLVKMDNGQVFETSAPGSVPEKTEVYENFEEKYMGRRLTIEYASLTSDGIPFHATALRWHEDL